MKLKTVSFIIPVYNASATIERLFNNLESDKLKLKFIVIDDASTDNSLGLLRQLETKSEAIKVICNKANKGVSYSRNVGLDFLPSSTDYVYFLDSDDLIDITTIERMVDVAEQKQAELVYGKLQLFDGNKCYQHIFNRQFFYSRKSLKTIGCFPELLMCPTLSNRLIKYDLLARLSLRFIEKRYYAEDFHYSCSLLLCARGIELITDNVVTIQDLGEGVKQPSLWNTMNLQRVWNTLDSVKDINFCFQRIDNKLFQQIVSYYTIYLLPRTILFFIQTNESFEYLAHARSFLKGLDLPKVPYGYSSKRFYKVAPIKSYFFMTLLLNNKLDKIKYYANNKSELKKALFKFMRENKPEFVGPNKLNKVKYFDSLNEAHSLNFKCLNIFDRVKQLKYFIPIRKSKLFDSKYYKTQTNETIAQISPLLHYLLVGGFKGYDPSSLFSNVGYYSHRADVHILKLNALGHFVVHGVLDI